MSNPTDHSRRFAAAPLFALGFRPFYLLAAVFAVLALPVWMMSFFGGLQTGGYLRGVAWHGHEMIFGFAAAVMAGFLLTAVRNWTGQQTPTGLPLIGLAAVWLVARLLIVIGPASAAAAVDVLFLPALGIAVAVPIWRSRNARNYKILALLAVLTLANAAYHLAGMNMLPVEISRIAITAALDAIAILIAIIGGRVIPAFIGNAVAHAEPRHNAGIEFLAVGALVIILGLDALQPWLAVSNTVWLSLLVVAAAGHAIRLMLWQPLRARGNPLLWMLPAAYAWLPISLALRAMSLLDITVMSASVHAFTVGAIASLMFAMMTRSALGHTGRALVAGWAEISAFILLQLAAIVRVIASSIASGVYREAMIVSGILWTVAFAVFLYRYWPILTQPRIDGRPG